MGSELQTENDSFRGEPQWWASGRERQGLQTVVGFMENDSCGLQTENDSGGLQMENDGGGQ